MHWGGNWGYTVPPSQVDFAHHLIDGGVDLVHGHSSHHPRAWEVYRGHLVLYGCGDLINDYEGITGHDPYRPDLRAAYLPDLDPDSGRLLRLRVAVLRSERLRLRLASHADRDHVRRALDDTGPPGRERLVHDGGLLSGPA
ncbi:CapA family protein [Actinoalloteichus caeruleus]|uniref:CapA family protein n=1 Tax=Actinoalloteichus cyanogriseus TaxID=2893586 RepID=UPI0020A36BA8